MRIIALEKCRIDNLLVERGFFTSRERARASILAGEIFVGDKRVDKCGENVLKESNIIYKGETMPFVSRGGLKLSKAIKEFDIVLKNTLCIDVGASTGGFTDCMLQNGATKVYAIDVGYGQFAWKLRIDPRVVCMERTNIRYVNPEDIGEACDFASIDVSFISLQKVIPAVTDLLNSKGSIVALIKPQFEAGREKIGKKGVVKDPLVHKEVIYRIVNFIENSDLKIINLSFSPVKGPEGNIEYLIYFTKDSLKKNFDHDDIEKIVELAHKSLDN